MTILLLGPSKWLPGRSPKFPHELRRALPPGWSLKAGSPSALDFRAALVGALQGSGHPATMLEMHPDVPGEAVSAKFLRIVQDPKAPVDQFFLWWPYGAARTGVDVEIGALLVWLNESRVSPEAIRIFVEDDGRHRRAGTWTFDKDGTLGFAWKERTRRAGYYHDWTKFGILPLTWRNYEELVTALIGHAGRVD